MKLNTNHRSATLKSFFCFAMIIILISINSLGTMDMIAHAATTPLAYYQNLEKDNLNKQVDGLTKAYADYILNYQTALKQQMGLETTVQATFDSSITDNTSFEGLNSIKASMISMVKGIENKTNGVISLNDKDLASFETYTTLNEIYYFMIPDLSKAYLKLDVKNMEGYTSTAFTQESIEDFLNDPISEDLLNRLMKKYGSIIIDNINNVTMKKDVIVNLDGVESDYTRLTVSINEMDLLDISYAILNAAKEDTDLRDLFVDLGICTNKEYNAAIKEGLTSLSDVQKELKQIKYKGEKVFKMYLWINSNGEIAGRSVSFNSYGEVVTFGYRTTKSGTKMGVEAWMISDGEDVLRGTGSLTGKLTGASGNIKVSLSDGYTTPIFINVDLKDVKYTKSGNNSFINGKIDITSKDLNGMSFNIKLNGDLDKQEFLVDMLYNNKSMASVSTMVKEVPFTDFSLPSSNDKIFDIDTQLEDYLKDADIKGFLEGIKEKSDLEFIDSYIDDLLASYDVK